MNRALKFRRMEGIYAVCKLPAKAPIPEWAQTGEFVSITRTVDELSIVCRQSNVPSDVPGGDLHSDGSWTCFKLVGPFAFSEIGIMASFLAPLSGNSVPIFSLSTFDTDYVLIKEGFLGIALPTLQEAGHELVP